MSIFTKGTTFKFPLPSGTKHKKIYFIISEQTSDNTVLVVSFNKFKKENRFQEQHCIINTIDHDCIKEKSVIDYDRALNPSTDELEKMLEYNNEIEDENEKLEILEKCSEELLQKIQEGAKKSELIKPKFKKLYLPLF